MKSFGDGLRKQNYSENYSHYHYFNYNNNYYYHYYTAKLVFRHFENVKIYGLTYFAPPLPTIQLKADVVEYDIR